MFKKYKNKNLVEFDEILMDSSNLPSFNQSRFEGAMERPIKKQSVFVVGVIFCLIALAFLVKMYFLQIVSGSEFRAQSENNRINEGVLVAPRGVIYDRKGEMLAWNEYDYSEQYDFPVRAYTDRDGLGQLTGYISYPKKDKSGNYYRTTYIGRTGIESSYDEYLKGENGKLLVEMDAVGEVISSHAVKSPKDGRRLDLSVDAALSEAMYHAIEDAVAEADFRSGAGAIMNIKTGEIVALTSFPSFDPEVMADGDDTELIKEYNQDDRFPFLNKVVGGAYTPGSIVKPFVAYAALVEGVATPNTTLYSDGDLELPNPYNDNVAVFGDWRRQGEMTLKEAIAFSSNVYFYILGGGLPEIALPQAGLSKPFEGLGISRIYEYMSKFGLGEKTGINLGNEQSGLVPNPEWKQKTFEDDWRLGDTYHTAIGQFAFQATPLQMLSAYGALASGGRLFTPHFKKGEVGEYEDIGLNEDALKTVKEGMRMTVTYDGGTARSLEFDEVAVAAKSGTAEIGSDNAHVNSWVAGYFPYEEPEYSFILLMDKAPRSNTLGATTIMGEVVKWMIENRPEYLKIETENQAG